MKTYNQLADGFKINTNLAQEYEDRANKTRIQCYEEVKKEILRRIGTSLRGMVGHVQIEVPESRRSSPPVLSFWFHDANGCEIYWMIIRCDALLIDACGREHYITNYRRGIRKFIHLVCDAAARWTLRRAAR